VDVQSLGDCGILIPSTDTKEKMMTEFAPRPVNVNGMSLTAYVDGVTMASVVARFGEGLMIGYEDDEKGYDGREVGFVHLPTGLEFYVYARWDAVRVGCRQDERTDAVSLSEELSRYLRHAATN
jgi:hypothetical protein